MNIVSYLSLNKAKAIERVKLIGKISFIKELRSNTDRDGNVMVEWLTPPRDAKDFPCMGLKEAKELVDLIDPDYQGYPGTY